MLANRGIQAVVVAVPDPLHVPLACKALQAGKHVLVEKPLGSSSVECRELVHLVESSGLKLQVGCMKRHDPGVRAARRHFQERMSPVLSFSAIYQDSVFRPAMQESCLDPLIPGSDAGPPKRGWKADRRRYQLFTQGAHLFDMLLYLAGTVSAVTAVEAELHGNYSWQGLLEGTHGALGHFELTCKSCGDWCERYKVCGDRGSVELDIGLWFYHRPAQVRGFDGEHQEWTQPLGQHSNAFANQMDAFADAIFHDRPTSPDVYEGLAVVELLEAVETSFQAHDGSNFLAPKRTDRHATWDLCKNV